MVWTARQVAFDFSTFSVGALLSGGILPRRGGADILTARSLASVGLTGLLGLPILLLASIALDAPLAGPAAISLGYLAAAHALALGRTRRAAGWTLAVLSGFVTWTLLTSLAGGATLAPAEMAAVLLAPLFAAAPALARRLMGGKADPACAAARRDTACLDRLAPHERMFVLDGKGRILSGTRVGWAELGLDPRREGHDITRSFHRLDAASLAEALAHCAAGAAPAELRLRPTQDEAGEGLVVASLTAGERQTVTLRLGTVRAVETVRRAAVVPVRRPDEIPDPAVAPVAGIPAAICDAQEALGFALRHVGPKARVKGVRLTCRGEATILAACDRQLCRRILILLLEQALGESDAGATVDVHAKSLRGAVLLRVVADVGFGTPGEGAAAETPMAGLRALVDEAGGSVVAERSGAGVSISIRLAPAGIEMRDGWNAGSGAN